jgi:hypothetical protein
MARLSSISRAAFCFAALPLLVSCGANDAPRATPSAVAVSAGTIAQSRASVATDYARLLQQIYIGYFGRPADPGGQDFWADKYAAAGMPRDIAELWRLYGSAASIRELVDVFGKSKESNDMYAGDDDAFIDAIYYNIFSRAPDAGGKAFWVSQIKSGTLTRPVAAITLLGAASGSDVQTLANKMLAADLYTSRVRLLDQSKFGSAAANALLRSMLRGITADTDPTAIQAAVAAAMSSILDGRGVVADAGPAQNATTGAVVRLNAAASTSLDGSPLTYAWTVKETPDGSRVQSGSLTAAASAAASFTADVPGRYAIALTVSNGKLTSAQSLTYVNVAPPDFPVAATGLYSVAVTGDRFVGPNLSVTDTDLYGQRDEGSFWDICNNGNCDAYQPGYELRSRGMGQLSTFALNVNAMPRAVKAAIEIYPGDNDTGAPGRYVLHYDANEAALAATPGGMQHGFTSTQYLSAYASPGARKQASFYFSGAARDELVPAGWRAVCETAVDITMYASWYDSQGQLVERRIPVQNRRYQGNFADTVTLDLNLDDFPDIKAKSASYSINVTNRLLFLRK